MKWQERQAALLATIVRFASNQSGQAWTEYGLIVALVAVTSVAAFATLGLAMADSFPQPIDELLQAFKKVKEQP